MRSLLQYAGLADNVLEPMLERPSVRAARVSAEKSDVYPDCDALGGEVFGLKDHGP